MITYAEQQAERKAEEQRLRKLIPSPMGRYRFSRSELRLMKKQHDALIWLAHYGWLPEREEAK